MATVVENTPKWFDAEFYLTNKLAVLRETEPSANWTREMLNKAFVDNGFSNPYDHYLAYGDIETLNPNALFDANEYVAAKAAQLGSTWTAEMVKQAIKDAGMTLAEHYTKYGFMEGLNPSSGFDQNKYLDAKLEQLLAEDPKGEWTIAKVRESFLANGITPLEHYMVYGKMEGLQDPKYDYSVNGNPIPHPGSDITLTTGTDEVGPKGAEGFVTSSRDDLIAGVVSSISSRGTFNNTDVIDGAEGRDVLKLDMQGSFGGFKDGAGVKNVETIVLDNAGGNNFNAKGVEGAGQYVVNVANDKTTNLTNIDSAHTSVQLTSGLKGTLNIGYTDAALSGKTDNAHVYLNGVGEAQETQTEHFNLKVAAASAAQKAETVTLNSMGKGNFVKLGGNYDTVAVTGTADLDLVVDVKDLKNFDASAALGAVEVDLTKSTDLKSVLGGEGDDTVIVSSLKSGAVLNGGAGKDTLRFEGIGGGVALKNTISDFETFVFKEGTDKAANVIDMTNITGLTSIKYEGDSAVAKSTNSFEVKHSSVSDFTFEVKNLKASQDVDIFHDPGAFAQVKYDGSGSLNLMLDSEGGTAQYSGFNQITANGVSSLNLSNANETTALWVSNITAKSVETLNIDTTGGGKVGVHVSHKDTAVDDIPSGNLSALTSIVAKGDGEAAFAASGTEKALTSIDVTELTGAFTLQLDQLAAGAENKGVEIHMGSGGTDGDIYEGYGMLGSKGNDTFYLGSGHETIRFGKDFAANGNDKINDFGSDDTINLNAVGAHGKSQLTEFKKADSKSAYTADAIIATGVTNAEDKAALENQLETMFSAASGSAATGLFVAVDGDSSAVWHLSVATANTDYVTLTLLGTVDYKLDSANIALDTI